MEGGNQLKKSQTPLSLECSFLRFPLQVREITEYWWGGAVTESRPVPGRTEVRHKVVPNVTACTPEVITNSS